jgi:soluble lytic murein transglycosylase
MQIMPATARRVARQIKVRYSRKKLLSDPEYNLRLGRAYLADLTEKYDGSYILALAAYNAGPARANRWMKAFGDPRSPGVDPIDWIESIPFNETRNYVQRILESLVVYRRSLGVPASDPVMAGRAPFRSLAENDKPD